MPFDLIWTLHGKLDIALKPAPAIVIHRKVTNLLHSPHILHKVRPIACYYHFLQWKSSSYIDSTSLFAKCVIVSWAPHRVSTRRVCWNPWHRLNNYWVRRNDFEDEHYFIYMARLPDLENSSHIFCFAGSVNVCFLLCCDSSLFLTRSGAEWETILKPPLCIN